MNFRSLEFYGFSKASIELMEQLHSNTTTHEKYLLDTIQNYPRHVQIYKYAPYEKVTLRVYINYQFQNSFIGSPIDHCPDWCTLEEFIKKRLRSELWCCLVELNEYVTTGVPLYFKNNKSFLKSEPEDTNHSSLLELLCDFDERNVVSKFSPSCDWLDELYISTSDIQKWELFFGECDSKEAKIIRKKATKLFIANKITLSDESDTISIESTCDDNSSNGQYTPPRNQHGSYSLKSSYKTPFLEIVEAVIEEFWLENSNQGPQKKAAVVAWIMENFSSTPELSEHIANQIDTITRHPDHKKRNKPTS